jgi:flavin-dependent dehydrogenase
LTGDAAGFVDPFIGEGIAYAIRSGQIAAEIVSDIVRRDKSPDTLKEYQSVCENEFGADLRYSLMLSRIMHRFPKVFFKILTSSDEAVDNLLDVAASKMTYESYIRWLIPRVPKFLVPMKDRKQADHAAQRLAGSGGT